MTIHCITYDRKGNELAIIFINRGFHYSIFFRNNLGRITNKNYPQLFKFYNFDGVSPEYYGRHIEQLINELKNHCPFVEGHQQKMAVLIKRISDPRVWKVGFYGD